MKVISRTDYPILKLNDKSVGALAQLVEQWTENPCVPGSIPGGTTKTSAKAGVFLLCIPSCIPVNGKIKSQFTNLTTIMLGVFIL